MSSFISKFCHLFAGLLLLTDSMFAANILVQFDPSQSGIQADPLYADGESSIFEAVADDSRVHVTLSGRDYLQDPLDGEVWGLLDNSLWWNEGRKGWLVRQGWESSVIGDPVNHQPDGDVRAAYLELKLFKSEAVMFESVTVSFENPVNTDFINLWGSNSTDGFSSHVLGVVDRSLNTEKAMVTFSGINYQGSDPLELRIYGVLGEDDGTFGVRLLLAIPEPGCSALALGALALVVLRRKRRSD